MKMKGKILIYLFGFCGVLLILLWLFQIVFLDDIYKRIKTNEVKKGMHLLIANINDSTLPSIIGRLNQNKGIDIEVLLNDEDYILSDRDGNEHSRLSSMDKKRIIDLALQNDNDYLENPKNSTETKSPEPDKEPTNLASKSAANPYIIKASKSSASNNDLAPPPEENRIFSRGRNIQQITYCKIIPLVDGSQLTILLTSTVSPVDATVEALRTEFLFITGFMIVFALLLSLFIARQIVTPIVSLNESARSLAQGKYDVTFHAKGYREIAELSNTLNIAAKELSTVENLRRELIANVSHDLKTPLTLIAGYAEVMRDLPNENTPENAQVIVDEANRLNKLVCDLLDLSKHQSGVLTPYPMKYNLTKSLRDTINRISEMTKNDGYTILFENDGEVWINADESQISQVVYNLLMNAINFTGKDKIVTVRQVIQKNKVTIQVIDSGKGIAPSEIPYVWDRYYRTGKKHKRSLYGSGIGLSIVKSVIELHQGEYGVISSRENGSIFWVSLPIVSTEMN